ncbi:MAG: LuxR C-terminal-related transcriptional regulator [Thermodesulfobacteriota bacterium]
MYHPLAAWAKGYVLKESIGRKSPLERLRRRERQVLHLVVDGASSPVIAEKLFLSPKTVETYRSRIMRKLGVRDITALVKFAVRHGIINVE